MTDEWERYTGEKHSADFNHAKSAAYPEAADPRLTDESVRQGVFTDEEWAALREAQPSSPTAGQDPEWRLLKNIQSWGNSVTFTMHERMEGRASQNDEWLRDVGRHITEAADQLLGLRREREARAALPATETLEARLETYAVESPVSEQQAATCDWRYEHDHDADYWDTECGEAFQFNDGGPRENNMKFCPYCGRTIVARLLRAEPGETK